METPAAVLRACYQMIPRLQAEESLLAAQRVGLGSGSYKKEDARRIVREWQRSARPKGQSLRPATAASVWGGLLEMMGDRIVRVPTKKAVD
jgi:hypothetical protein